MITDRERRLFPQQHPIDKAKGGNIRYLDGEVRPGITVKGQVVKMDFSKIYPDDAVAFIRDMYETLNASRPCAYNTNILTFLKAAIYTADRRAVVGHGYSWCEKERGLKLPKDY